VCLEDNANSVVLMVIWRMVVVVSVGSGAPCVPRDLADLVYGIEPVRPRAPQIIAVPGPSQAGFTAEVPLVEESRGAGDWTDVVRGTRGASQAAQAERLTSTSDKRLCRPNSPGDGVGHNESYWLSIPYEVRDTFLGLWIPRSRGSMDAGISVRTGEPGWSWGGSYLVLEVPRRSLQSPYATPTTPRPAGFLCRPLWGHSIASRSMPTLCLPCPWPRSGARRWERAAIVELSPRV